MGARYLSNFITSNQTAKNKNLHKYWLILLINLTSAVMRAIKCFEMYENFVLRCMKGYILQPGTSEAFQSRGHIGTLYIYQKKDIKML